MAKSCAKFELLLVNIQRATACLFENVNFKFKLFSVKPYQLFQRNLQDMLREYSYNYIIRSLVKIRTTVAEIQEFSRGFFLLAHPVHINLSDP